jgi:C4-dicarboxylate transporter/malic acid transport protein
MTTATTPIERRISPRWFTSVMGTGIVATAAAGLPDATPDIRHGALAVWILAAALLVLLSLAYAVHAIAHRATARGHAEDPGEAPFYGAPAMATLTVGAGALLVGRDVIGLHAALAVDWTLWVLGTIAGLASALAVPYLMFTRHDLAPEDASAAWLMPVVPPMVSAATGALLIPYAPSGQPRLTLLLACLGLFGLAGVSSMLVATLLWARLTHHNLPLVAAQPTLWILLGPFGTSITAAAALARVAGHALRPTYATAVRALPLLYGVPAYGFAVLWLALVVGITVRAVHAGLPFTPSWWSFVFPLGTFVTATSGLAERTGSVVLHDAAPILLAVLVLAWLTVATSTLADVTRPWATHRRGARMTAYGQIDVTRGSPAARH